MGNCPGKQDVAGSYRPPNPKGLEGVLLKSQYCAGFFVSDKAREMRRSRRVLTATQDEPNEQQRSMGRKRQARHGPMVKRLRHRPFTAVTRVRSPVGSPHEHNQNPFLIGDKAFGFCITGIVDFGVIGQNRICREAGERSGVRHLSSGRFGLCRL